MLRTGSHRSLLAALTLLALGCGGKGAPAPAATTPPLPITAPADAAEGPAPVTAAPDAVATAGPASDVVSDAAPGAGFTPGVRLLDAGAEPRTAHTYRVGDADRRRLVLTMGMDVSVSADGRPATQGTLPAITLAVELRTRAVPDRQGAAYTFEVADLRFEADEAGLTGLAATLAEDLTTLRGARGEVEVDARGRALRADYSLDDAPAPTARDAHAAFRKALTQLAVPLPAEAIGVGARWEVSQPVSQGGVEIAQLTTYTLTAVDGDRLTLALVVAQRATGEAKEDGDTRITRFEGAGTGAAVVDLRQLAPASYQADIETTLGFDITSAGRQMPMLMEVDLRMRVGAPPESPDKAPEKAE